MHRRSRPRLAGALIVVFLDKLPSQSRERTSLSNAREACRNVAYPLDAQTATAVEPSLEHGDMSWNILRGEGIILDWVLDDSDTCVDISGEELAEISNRIERGLRTLARSDKISFGKLVWLPTSPHSFLSTTPLLDGRWIDATVLELAEMGVILTDTGFTLQASGDPHPLAWDEITQLNSQGESSQIDAAAWHEAR